ncbi:hypothetical protein W911_03540 [Hyphomicrobium nitrativorans NL23]|uniref:Uncharacterized protein n=1 Tax=Hyphomicrobium nitrativorans NL23 TaxID=1029756 RepID=V5SHC1_9HYPH|nr:hypothetical protein W911_03540 [Hyphomicrobium nitrativorans NL23]
MVCGAAVAWADRDARRQAIKAGPQGPLALALIARGGRG